MRATPAEIEVLQKIRITFSAKNITALDLLDKVCEIANQPFDYDRKFALVSFNCICGPEKIAIYSLNPKTAEILFNGEVLAVEKKLIEMGAEFFPSKSDVVAGGKEINAVCAYSRGMLMVKCEKEQIKRLDWILNVKHILDMGHIPRNTEEKSFPGQAEESTLEIQKKLSDIIIDHIEYEDVKVTECIKHILQRSKELDPEKKGIEIQTIINNEDDIPSITMLVDDIPLGDAVRYICRGANLKYRIHKDKVIIASQDVPLDPIVEKCYPVVESVNIEELDGEIEKYLRCRGISFVTGTRVIYDNEKRLLVVRQTVPVFREIEEIFTELCGYRTKFIFDKSNPVAAKIAGLKPGDFVEVKGEMQIKEAKFNGYPFPQPCFLIKDIEAIKNPVLPKLRKYEPKNASAE